jgi:hypothetical protein
VDSKRGWLRRKWRKICVDSVRLAGSGIERFRPSAGVSGWGPLGALGMGHAGKRQICPGATVVKGRWGGRKGAALWNGFGDGPGGRGCGRLGLAILPADG